MCCASMSERERERERGGGGGGEGERDLIANYHQIAHGEGIDLTSPSSMFENSSSIYLLPFHI